MKTLMAAALALGMGVACTNADVIDVPLNDTNAADNFLYNNGPTQNFAGSQLYYYDSRGGSEDKGRPLIMFNLVSLPPCATINSVQLKLWVDQYTYIDTNNNSVIVPWNFTLHQMLVSWSETSSNWNERSTGVAWSTPGMAAGVDYMTAAAATTEITGSSASSGDYKVWDITTLYKQWANGTAPNYGVHIHGPTGVPGLTTSGGDTTDGVFLVLASEYANDARRPHLVIDYTLPSGECNACCFSNGSCQAMAANECTAAQGTPQASGSVCGPSTCPVNGACCTGTACTSTTSAACGGSFKGVGSTCQAPGNPTTCCKANFNGVGGVSVQDIFDFLAAWFGSNLTADFNGSGAVSVQDIFDFLAAWFAGCTQ